MVTDLPDYEKKIIIVTPPGEYPALIQIDHRKILGVDLRSPTFAACVPTSIENDAIAYDSANDRFKVILQNSDFPDAATLAELALILAQLDSKTSTLFKAGQNIGNTGFNVNNLPSDYPDASALTALGLLLKTSDLSIEAITKHLAVDVQNFPSFPTEIIVNQSDQTKLKATVTQASAERTLAETGTVTHFSKTATGDVKTSTSGKASVVNGFFFYCTTDITVELRFKTSGNVIGGIVAKGACGMNLLGMKKPQGAANEVIEIYLSNTGTVKGWISTGEV